MRPPFPTLTLLVLCACAFVLLHAGALFAFRAQATLVTYPFLLLCPAMVMAACIRRAAQVGRHGRSAWILLAAGMFL